MRSECSSPTSHDASLVLADFGEGQRAGAVADFRHDAVPALVDHVAEQLGVLLDGRGLGDDARGLGVGVGADAIGLSLGVTDLGCLAGFRVRDGLGLLVLERTDRLLGGRLLARRRLELRRELDVREEHGGHVDLVGQTTQLERIGRPLVHRDAALVGDGRRLLLQVVGVVLGRHRLLHFQETGQDDVLLDVRLAAEERVQLDDVARQDGPLTVEVDGRHLQVMRRALGRLLGRRASLVGDLDDVDERELDAPARVARADGLAVEHVDAGVTDLDVDHGQADDEEEHVEREHGPGGDLDAAGDAVGGSAGAAAVAAAAVAVLAEAEVDLGEFHVQDSLDDLDVDGLLTSRAGH